VRATTSATGSASASRHRDPSPTRWSCCPPVAPTSGSSTSRTSASRGW